MNNNLIFLSGWLELAGKPSPHSSNLPALSGWLHTDEPSAGGRHPVILIGPSAEKARVWQRTLGKCFFAVLQGELHSAPDGRHGVIARFVRPFDAPYPTCSDGDVCISNVVFLSGWMERLPSKPERMIFGGLKASVVRTYLYTEKDYAGGKHPVTLTSRQAEVALESGNAAISAGQKGYYAVIEGRLFSYENEHHVYSDRIYPLMTGQNTYNPETISAGDDTFSQPKLLSTMNPSVNR